MKTNTPDLLKALQSVLRSLANIRHVPNVEHARNIAREAVREATRKQPADRPAPSDRLTYEVFGGAHRHVRITDVEDDIKNGKPGFGGVADDGLTVWGYDYQIIRYHSNPHTS